MAVINFKVLPAASAAASAAAAAANSIYNCHMMAMGWSVLLLLQLYFNDISIQLPLQALLLLNKKKDFGGFSNVRGVTNAIWWLQQPVKSLQLSLQPFRSKVDPDNT